MGQRKSTIPPSVPSDNSETDALDLPYGAHAPDGTAAPDKRDGTEPTADTDTPAAPDPFDPASLRLSQDYAANIGVKKALLSVPVRKPDKSWFVRVHPSKDYRLPTPVIELKEDRETYLV